MHFYVLKSIDGYHCNIYRVRFRFLKTLIAKVSLDPEDNINLEIPAFYVVIPKSMLLRAYQYMLWYRENCTEKEGS